MNRTIHSRGRRLDAVIKSNEDRTNLLTLGLQLCKCKLQHVGCILSYVTVVCSTALPYQ